MSIKTFAGKIYFDLEIIFYTVIPQVSAHSKMKPDRPFRQQSGKPLATVNNGQQSFKFSGLRQFVFSFNYIFLAVFLL